VGAIEEGGKVANGLIEAMKNAPLALALLVVNFAFLGFCGYLLHEVAANARERNQQQMQMISSLVTSCSAPRS
jgi:hypothetical protein